MNSGVSNEDSTKANKVTFKLDLQLIVILLLVVIMVMLLIWKPWSPNHDAKNRTITVTGETTMTAVPDEYVFYPSYQFKNTDKTAALAEVTKKSNEVIEKLKNLGVADNKIKSDSSGNPYYGDSNDQNTYSLQLTITVNDKNLIQKVQDYLITTAPTGAISPQASFSDKLKKELENKGRDKASKDARVKADRTVKNLGFSLGKIKSISGNNASTTLFSNAVGKISPPSDVSESSRLDVQPGENKLPYSIVVTYYITD